MWDPIQGQWHGNIKQIANTMIEKRFFETDSEMICTSSSGDNGEEESSCTVDYESDDKSGKKHSSALLDENIGAEEKTLIHVMEKLVVDEDSYLSQRGKQSLNRTNL